MPNAKIDACENAPPVNIFNNPNNPSEVCCCRLPKSVGSTPGNTTKDPKR